MTLTTRINPMKLLMSGLSLGHPSLTPAMHDRSQPSAIQDNRLSATLWMIPVADSLPQDLGDFCFQRDVFPHCLGRETPGWLKRATPSFRPYLRFLNPNMLHPQ
jgi:hypothetical protein